MKLNDSDSLLEFPCEFPIKAFGLSEQSLETTILELVQRHAPQTKREDLTSRPSQGGKYTAVTIQITAQSKIQLDAIYRELSTHPAIIMAL